MRVGLLIALCLSAAWAQTVPADPLASAKLLTQKGEYEKAAAAFQAIVEKDPTSAEAQAGLARCLLQFRKLDEADAAVRKAIAALPKSAAVQAAFGDVGFRTGHFADAESGYRTALQLDPNSARGWFGMGRMFDLVSMHKQARGAFAKARQLDPADKQIEESWLSSLSYAEQLEFLKNTHSDGAGRKERILFLESVVQKKPWQLAGETKATEIKMLPYGREDSYVSSRVQFGARPVARGFGLTVKINDHASALLLLDTRTDGISIGTKLAEKAGVVKIAD
ncbi:MAG TPA: tetratricopeptide repeat protein, partial [Candidatus Angelobacter sp.]|nr:tetratricopeptide repeat protein [Candidatus Angelobacter sp.]